MSKRALDRPYIGDENGNILHKAYDLINGDRQKDYGSPWSNFGLLADFFTSYAKKRWNHVDVVFSRNDVVNFLILLKVSRACVERPTQDTYVDIAGYAGLGGDFEERVAVDEVWNTEDDAEGVCDARQQARALTEEEIVERAKWNALEGGY